MGRKTDVRRRIIELLFFLKEAYGYEIYQHYVQIYPKVSMRLIYYHLSRGVITGEFEALEVRREEGSYSWGNSAEKIYYRLGPEASPIGDPRVERYIEDMISQAYERRRQKKPAEEDEKAASGESVHPDPPR